MTADARSDSPGATIDEREDALGRAMLDFQRHGRTLGECVYRDGARRTDGEIEGHYFSPREDWHEDAVAALSSLSGPVLDAGCGAGQHALWLGDHGVDVTGIDVSPGAVEAARERGVEDARVADMFDLPAVFPRDRFRSVLVEGTQAGLAGSLAGLSSFLADLAYVTDEDGVAVLDSYVPGELDPEFFGHRPDPRRGICHRVMHFEYHRTGVTEGDGSGPTGRLLGRPLHFLLFDPDRLVEATVGTPWELDRVYHRTGYYRALLSRR